jgi:asparagine synthase (glutamine-hydrolysing)
MAMHFALEVRCPFLDARLAQWVARLPARLCHDGRTPKKILKTLALRYLPPEIVHRRKQGFGVPEQCWGRERLLELAESLLLDPGSRVADYLDRDRLRRHLVAQGEPARFQVYQVWELLVLEQWLRGAVDGLRRSSRRRASVLAEV